VPLLWLVLFMVLAVAGWRAWQSRVARDQARAHETTQQWQALEARIDALRRDQRAQAQRLQQADATNRVLRDELLGLDQRAALLEDNVRQLGDPQRHGVEALRMDEAALLLGQGEARLRLSGDLDGARRAYALAAGVLAGIDGSRADSAGLLNARQSLVQERAALDALGADPKALAAARLDAFATTLASPPNASTRSPRGLPWWRRAFSRLIDVAPVDRSLALPGADRAAAFAALQLEIALARAAVERRDEPAFRAALARADGWLARLWPDSPGLRQRRAQLQALRGLPLVLRLPMLGSTREQLQGLAAAR
jgi:uroporphyrin-3 C-methyltransferase